MYFEADAARCQGVPDILQPFEQEGVVPGVGIRVARGETETHENRKAEPVGFNRAMS